MASDRDTLAGLIAEHFPEYISGHCLCGSEALNLASWSAHVADVMAAAGVRPPAQVMPAERTSGEMVTASLETVVDVYLDGLGTGAASTLARVKPDAPPTIVDRAAQALVDAVKADPLAVEQLREQIRKRLRGEQDNEITEVRFWNGGAR